ncbi:MAG: hypothetical protein P8Y42_16905 [Exilibacterium sp.]
MEIFSLTGFDVNSIQLTHSNCRSGRYDAEISLNYGDNDIIIFAEELRDIHSVHKIFSISEIRIDKLENHNVLDGNYEVVGIDCSNSMKLGCENINISEKPFL